MTRVTMPPPAGAKPATNGAPARPKLGRSKSEATAPRIILNAVEGWGKTSFAAYAPNCAVLMSRGETGYTTLLNAQRVPDRDRVEFSRWPDVLAQVDDLITECPYGAVALDALGGFERLCHEHICARDFSNDWGERGFGSFQKGYEVSLPEWIGLLAKLDRVRAAHNIPIILLSHSKVKNFKNPMGADFDRYIADCHEKTWSVTHKWADAVLFGTYVTVAVEDKKSKRTKGIGGDQRVLFTTRRDAYDAKNRYGLPAQLDVPDDPAKVWDFVWDAIQGKGAEVAEAPPV